jgi:hypothetical protein
MLGSLDRDDITEATFRQRLAPLIITLILVCEPGSKPLLRPSTAKVIARTSSAGVSIAVTTARRHSSFDRINPPPPILRNQPHP